MGAVNTTYTFTANDTITSTKMNDIIDQTTVTGDAIFGQTLEVVDGKLKVRSQNITSNELADSAVTSLKLAAGAVSNTNVADAAAIAGTKVSPNFGSQSILTTGNAGIGTNTPFGKMTVSNDDQDGVSMFSQTNTTFIELGGFRSGTDGAAHVKYTRSSGVLEFANGTRATKTQRMFIDGVGQIGLGAGLNGDALNSIHINGGLRYTSPNAAGTGTALVIDGNGDVKASSSSIRYKNSIENYAKGLEEIKKLRPVTYKFNGENATTAGLIAEELDILGMSEYVIKNSDGQPESIMYAQIVALLINGIKELSVKIESIENNLG